MNRQINPVQLIIALALMLSLSFLTGHWWAGREHLDMNHSIDDSNMVMATDSSSDREILYWYDPMVPQQHFDQPGQSPFMDMALIPRYADENGADAVLVDAARTQSLGMRLAMAREIDQRTEITATGVLQFNRRQQADVQLRTNGFVESFSPLAEGDRVEKGQLLARLTLPAWTAAQQEYLSARSIQDPALLSLARERLLLLGMEQALIDELDTTGSARFLFPVTAPIGGVLEAFTVSAGMSLASGASLARIINNEELWLEVAVPERYAGQLQAGDHAMIRLDIPGSEALHGSVEAVLPMLDLASRTLRVRISLPNPGQRLQAGLSAQVTLQAGEALRGIAIPTEALIRTGQRSLVMLAEQGGRFRPVEVTPGRESGQDTLILSGLSAGQQVVASGQFLLDSEASLLGIVANSMEMDTGTVQMPAPQAATLHEAEARVMAVEAGHITLEHDAFTSLPMPAMTMRFPVGDAALLNGISAGDTVRAGLQQDDSGLVIMSLRKTGESSDGGDTQ